VCLEIARYLVRHPQAADTVRGVAQWWVRRAMPTTEAALRRLADCGVVSAYTMAGTATIYAYTKDPALREVVAECIGAIQPPGADEA
jgi:hypothetical protein